MRKRIAIQYEHGVTPIEDLEILAKSQDQLPSLLRAFQYIYTIQNFNQQVLEIRAAKVLWEKTGRNGITLWEILVLTPSRVYSLQCIQNNLGLIDNETLEQVNALIVVTGHQLGKINDKEL